MLTLLISVLIPTCIVLVFRLLNKPHKPPLFGIYQQKNKYFWFKFAFLFLVLNVRQWIWRFKRAYAVDVGKSCDGTIHVHEEDALLEQKHDLGDYPLAVDATYFNGISKDGDSVMFALARRQGNFCDAQASMKLNGEKYLSPKLPDSYLEQDENDRGEFRVQGIQIENFIPMRTWKLTYNGDMKLNSDPEKTVKVEADLTWSALFAPFNYDHQLSPCSVASDMARELWSRDYFRTVQKFHQSHYEQIGFLKGFVYVDGKKHIVKMPCFRDRTFGKVRDWRNFHRYVFHTFFLENGDSIVVGSVSQPLVMSHALRGMQSIDFRSACIAIDNMTIGFVCRKSDQTVFVVQSSDFKLYQHGENQIVPKDYGFSFKAGGQRYTVQVKVDDESVCYMGKHRESKFYENWLTVDVNGVKGRGFGQWQYNNVQASTTVN